MHPFVLRVLYHVLCRLAERQGKELHKMLQPYVMPTNAALLVARKVLEKRARRSRGEEERRDRMYDVNRVYI